MRSGHQAGALALRLSSRNLKIVSLVLLVIILGESIIIMFMNAGLFLDRCWGISVLAFQSHRLHVGKHEASCETGRVQHPSRSHFNHRLFTSLFRMQQVATWMRGISLITSTNAIVSRLLASRRPNCDLHSHPAAASSGCCVSKFFLSRIMHW